MATIEVLGPDGQKVQFDIKGTVPTAQEEQEIQDVLNNLQPPIGEYNPEGVQSALDRGVSESSLLDQMEQNLSPNVMVNDKAVNIADAREQVGDAELMKILTTGTGYTKPDSQVEAAGMGVNYGLTNLLGLPVDFVNAGVQKAEQGARKAINYLTGAGLSTDEEDLLFSSTNPVGGAKMQRQGLEALGLEQIDNIEELPPEYRTAAQAGRVIGEGGVPIFAPFALARAGIGVTHPFIQAAINSPKTVLAQEAAALGGAAQGAAIMQIVAPDNMYAQMAGEFIGSLVSPTKIVGTLASPLTKGAKRALKTALMGEKGAQSEAINQIARILVKQGYDPKEVADQIDTLLNSNISKSDLTGGQLTGNEALIGLENKIASTNSEFNKISKDLLENALGNIRMMADQAGGDLSGGVRKAYFDTLLDAQVDNARNAVTQAASQFDAADMRGASKAAYEAVYNAEKQVREVEDVLWNSIPKNISATAQNTLQAFAGLKQRVLEGETLFRDPELERVVNTFINKNVLGKAPLAGSTTSGELVRFRSRLLTLARAKRSGANPDMEAYSQLMKMADGALEDLNLLQGTGVDVARDFSVALNDRFSRTFAGDALQTQGSGALSINPEQTLERAFGSGKTSGDINMQQLQQATEFADQAAVKASQAQRASTEEPDTLAIEQDKFINVPSSAVSTDRVVPTAETMGAAQEEFLQGYISATRDPTTGEFSQQRLNRFLADNVQLLERFPELRGKIQNLSDNLRIADDTEAALGAAARAEDTSDVIVKALKGQNPTAEYSNLARVATESGPEAVEGLKRATFDGLIRNSKGVDGNTININKLGAEFFGTATPNGKTRVDLMLEAGVLSPQEADQIGALITEGMRLDAVGKNTAQLNEVVDKNADILNNVARIAGANLSNKLPISGVGPNLQSAQILSAQAKKLVEAIPAGKVTNAITQLLQDPQRLAAGLRMAQSNPQDLREFIRETINTTVQGLVRTPTIGALTTLEGEQPELPTSETDRMLEEEAVN